MATIFFSYSHKDEELRDHLETHLAMLRRQGFIETWHDRRIVAGDEFNGRISQELERADIIMLLVSSDFLASEYCYDIEVKRAMERHEAGEARVIPVILRSCDWHDAPFGKLLAAPRDGKPIRSWPDLDDAFLNVVKTIKEALKITPGTRNATRGRSTSTSSEPRPAEVSTDSRSSNLRLKKVFGEACRDRFLDEAFGFMARFFETSLNELKSRNPEIEISFRRIDANRFTAVAYRDGVARSRCKIILGGGFGRGITFSQSDRADDNSFNESISVEADEQSLYLRAMGMAHWDGERDTHLTFEGAAEYYWSIFLRPLQ